MAESVLYFRGISTIAERAPRNPATVAALKLIGGLSEEQVAELVGRLTASTGFLDERKLRAAIRDIVPAGQARKAVQRVLQNFNSDEIESVLDAVDSQRKVDKKLAIDDPEMTTIRRNLMQLVQTYPALKRFEKATRLATLTGQQLESIDLICDLRPIFDDSRTSIEGMMPYTRLRVVATGADGLPRSFEAELSATQLHDLAEKAGKARMKIGALREAVEAWLPDGIPNLPLTRVPREESSDA